MLGYPHSWSKVWEALDREIGKPGENCCQIVAHWEFNRRQLSTTERIAATLGPACGLPMCIQFPGPEPRDALNFPQGYCSVLVPDIPGIV